MTNTVDPGTFLYKFVSYGHMNQSGSDDCN